MKQVLIPLFTLLIIVANNFDTKAQQHKWDEKGNSIQNLETLKPGEYDNVKVQKLSSTPEATGFLIWLKDTVKPHYHAGHTETLYFIEGEGIFYIGGKVHRVKPGDYVSIKKMVVHSFKATSKVPVKALSLQTPEFSGKDRIFIETDKNPGATDY